MNFIPLALLVILIILPTDVSGNRTVLADFSGDTSYNILIQTSRTQLNPGDHLRIELFITGLGDVEISKLYVVIPVQLPSNGKINFTDRKYNRISPSEFKSYYESRNFSSNGFYHLISKNTYMMLDISAIEGLEEAFQGTDLSGASGLILGETRTNDNPTYFAPYTIDFIIAENASAGDYKISILYTYGNLNRWYQDEEVINVHINYIYEREYFKWLIYIVTFIAALNLLEHINRLRKRLWNWLS
jgi:hypothetical protein